MARHQENLLVYPADLEALAHPEPHPELHLELRLELQEILDQQAFLHLDNRRELLPLDPRALLLGEVYLKVVAGGRNCIHFAPKIYFDFIQAAHIFIENLPKLCDSRKRVQLL